MTNVDLALEQLGTGLKELDKAKKILSQVTSDLVSELPKDKRVEASNLINKARNGKAGMSEFMTFVKNIKKDDKEGLKKSFEEVVKKYETVKNK